MKNFKIVVIKNNNNNYYIKLNIFKSYIVKFLNMLNIKYVNIKKFEKKNYDYIRNVAKRKDFEFFKKINHNINTL